MGGRRRDKKEKQQQGFLFAFLFTSVDGTPLHTCTHFLSASARGEQSYGRFIMNFVQKEKEKSYNHQAKGSSAIFVG